MEIPTGANLPSFIKINKACHRVLVFEIILTIYVKDLQIQRFQTRL